MPETATLWPLAPARATFPEVRCERATIVCEGPSVCFATPEALRAACLDGPIIAVNRAIALSDRLPVDVWATMDDPQALWDEWSAHLHPEAKLFSGNDVPNIWVWRKILGEDAGGRLYVRDPTYMEDLAEVSVDGAAPMLPTLFHVLAWLLQVKCQHVRLLGVDMHGFGSPLAGCWSETEDEGHELRWGIERHLLALSIKQYRARGARIERCLL